MLCTSVLIKMTVIHSVTDVQISKAAKKTTQKGKQKAKQATSNGGGGLFGFLKK